MNSTIYVLEGNDQVYVGATTRDLYHRLKEHKYGNSIGRQCRSRWCFGGDKPPTIRAIQHLAHTTHVNVLAREKYFIRKLASCNLHHNPKMHADNI